MESDIPMCIVIEEKVRSECSVREKKWIPATSHFLVRKTYLEETEYRSDLVGAMSYSFVHCRLVLCFDLPFDERKVRMNSWFFS